MTSQKIVDIKEMADISRTARAEGRRVVLCHGTFDLMHTGHIRYLQRSAQEGDVLMVTLTADAYVNKGPGRPVFNEMLRAENLAALACVDYVSVNYHETAVEALSLIRPDVYAKGSEYRDHEQDVTGNILKEIDAVEAGGGRIFYTDEITFSSSKLLKEHFGVFPSETKRYLDGLRKNWSEKELLDKLASFSSMNVLVVGDAIIDQYHYASALGQTGKGNVLAVRYNEEEEFAGGAIAVANHIAGFAGKVTLATALGEENSGEGFIRDALLPNVEAKFWYFKDAPTVTKRRFVEADMSKLFEVYYYDEDPEIKGGEEDVCCWLDNNVGEYDAVIVPDFGNGFISSGIINSLVRHARYLSVNTQINSGNRGYHVIHRYPRADFVSLNEPEMRLATHDRKGCIKDIVKKVSRMLHAKHVAVTRGAQGMLMYDAELDVFAEVPALSTKVVDRIGAGDAFLSLAGISLAADMPFEVAGFIGSATAAIDVQIVCNRDPVSFPMLSKYIGTLLK